MTATVLVVLVKLTVVVELYAVDTVVTFEKVNVKVKVLVEVVTVTCIGLCAGALPVRRTISATTTRQVATNALPMTDLLKIVPRTSSA